MIESFANMKSTKKYHVMTKPWDYFISIYIHALQMSLSDTNVIYGQDKRNVHKFVVCSLPQYKKLLYAMTFWQGIFVFFKKLIAELGLKIIKVSTSQG